MAPKKKIRLADQPNQKKISDFWHKASNEEKGQDQPTSNIATSPVPIDEPTTSVNTDSPVTPIDEPPTSVIIASKESVTSTQDTVTEMSQVEMMVLLRQYFSSDIDTGKCHNFYLCSGKCSQLSESETDRIRSEKTQKQKVNTEKKKRSVNMFKHSWLTDKNTAFCTKTGIWWLVYIEGSGMFCLLCRIHNTTNKFNKLNTFNVSPSTNYKHSAIAEHHNSTGHLSTYLCELERRHSSIVSLHKETQQTKDVVTFNVLLTTYWLATEELANRKLLSLVNLEKQIGCREMEHYKNTSERSQKNMRLLISQLIKAKLIDKIKNAKWYSILVDEVTDCSTIEQLLIYVGYVDTSGTSNFDFLDVKDVLEHSDSPDAETITKCITDELKACGIRTEYLCGFGSDRASVMTGVHSGVGARLQKLSSSMIRSHCISHRLALACGDSNETVKYVTTIEVTLRQLWKWLEYPKRCAAFVKVCKSIRQIELATTPAKLEKVSKKLAVKIQKACRTRWLSTGQSIASVCRNLVALMLTLRQFKEHDATAQGLLTRMNNTKFVGTILLLNTILPHLNSLSKAFQKDHILYMSIKPTLEATKAHLTNIRASTDIVHELECAIQEGGVYAKLELQLPETSPVRNFLQGLLTNYTSALEQNLDRRFLEASPVLQAFSIFDPSILPKPSDFTFKEYGQQDICLLNNQFKFHEDETLAQWQNFKYQMSSWNIPEHILRGEDISPTQFILVKLVREQATHRICFNNIVDFAQICLTQPLSNAVVERGASAVKRVKTRLRSSLKNDMLSSLLDITLNGPPHQSNECIELLNEATQIWRKTHVRNLPTIKFLPRIGGSDHTDVLSQSVVTVECGIQTDLREVPALNLGEVCQAEEDAEALDRHVQVQVQPVCGDSPL